MPLELCCGPPLFSKACPEPAEWERAGVSFPPLAYPPLFSKIRRSFLVRHSFLKVRRSFLTVRSFMRRRLAKLEATVEAKLDKEGLVRPTKPWRSWRELREKGDAVCSIYLVSLALGLIYLSFVAITTKTKAIITKAPKI